MNRPLARLAAAVALALACAGPRPPPAVAIPYPPAPQRTRLVYRGQVATERDVASPGFWERLGRLFGGERRPLSLDAPFDVTFDPAGRLVVTDAGRHEVLVLDRDRGRVEVIAPGGDDALALPLGVAADAAGRIYVADGLRGVVRVFGRDLRPAGRIDCGARLVRPTGLALDRERGVLYVADTPSHVVRAVRLDGTPLRDIGGHGAGPGQLNFPTFLAVAPGGDLLVNDTMNFRVSRFDPGGAFVASFGKAGNGSGDMGRSKGLAVDHRGHVYVADALFDNFQIFDARGRLLLFVGGHGRKPGEFWLPSGMAIGGAQVAVADRANGRVQLFEIVTEDDTEEGSPP